MGQRLIWIARQLDADVAACGEPATAADGDWRDEVLAPRHPPACVDSEVAHIPGLVVEIELADRAYLTVFGADPVPPQIPDSEQHRFRVAASAAPAWLRDDPA